MKRMMDQARQMLERWADAVEPMWYFPPGGEGLACFGSGYIHWGVQSNLNVAAALATLAMQPGVERAGQWRERALAALRFALATHVTGDRQGTNGQQWGRSWISVLGLERSMHGLRHLHDAMSEADHAAFRRMMRDEACWLLHEGHRGSSRDVHAGQWNHSGKNAPESNIWNGSFLWRVSRLWPDAPEAGAMAERAHDYLINGVSVPADVENDAVVAGRPVRERHVGANFFSHYALDHHGYLNVGYMAICVSNAAMLHFDARHAGFDAPASLHHGQGELWQVLRRMLFPDGRLCRIGGDSRVRYAYCQEYLLPALLYAADHLGDAHAPQLAQRLVSLMRQEHQASGNGSFYHGRMGDFAAANPHYYARLESDRAVVLAMLLNHAPLVAAPAAPDESFEASVAGGWEEPEHGAVMHRGTHRLASFTWRALGLTQAMAQPPTGSDLVDWSANLCPVVRFLGDPGEAGKLSGHRRLLRHMQTSFSGGFVTCGSVMEGVDLLVDEGARISDIAVSHIAFAALPDGRTCVGLQRVVMAGNRMGYLQQLKGLHLNLVNDVFNGRVRRMTTAAGETVLHWPPEQDEVVDLASPWLHVDGLGVVAVYGGNLLVDRSRSRRGGRYRSLAVEEVCLVAQNTLSRCEPGDVLLDAGFAVLSDVTVDETREIAAERLDLPGELRGIVVTGCDGNRYDVVANFADETVDDFPAGEARVSLHA